MSGWLEHKYIGFVSTRLDKFKRKSSNLYNFRCPLCGDSESNRNKARGYLYEKDGKLMFHCHNCGATLGFTNFLKTVDANLHNEYLLEKLENKKTVKDDFDKFVEKMKKPVFLTSGPLKGLKKVSQLSPDNPVKRFVVERKIPNEWHAKLFSCPNFLNFTNGLLPDKFSADSLSMDETRLLIPFFNTDKSVIGYQGRSLRKQSAVKYITIILQDSAPKLFNLDTVDSNKDVYVFEGPLDAMFVRNSIATLGGDLISAVRSLNKENLVICYDNEPRSRETVKKIDKAIMNGYRVCIWPENFEHKDVNDAITSGLTSDFVQYIIKQNTYKDLSAKLALQRWSKL